MSMSCMPDALRLVNEARGSSSARRFTYRDLHYEASACSLAGLDEQAALIARRALAGEEMEHVGRFMQDPGLTRRKVVDYIRGLLGSGRVTRAEATALLGSLPRNKDGIHQWAKMMFTALMHVGIYGHAVCPEVRQ